MTRARFGDFVLDAETGELTRKDRPVKLHPQPAKLLTLLVERPGSLVSREEIQSELWKDETHVDYDLGINSCIRQIRRALQDDPDHPRFVETVPRKGYRFIGTLEDDERKTKTSPRRWPVGLGLLATAVAAAVWLASSSSERDSVSPPARTIPLTTFPGIERFAAISPDGNQVVYSWDGGAGLRPQSLYVQLIDGSEPLQLTRTIHRDYSPAWSPDGRRIAFLREIREKGKPGMSEIRIISALGGKESPLGTTAVKMDMGPYFVSGLDWSPDGKYLAFADTESYGQPERIFLLSVETGERRRLSAPPLVPQPSRDSEPAFSPDGRTVAFARGYLPADFQVVLVDVDGDEERVLHTETGQVYDLDWVPDGSALIYARRRWELSGLTRIALDGRVSDLADGHGAVSVSLSEDGQRLAFTQDHGFVLNVWRAPGPTATEATEPVKLIPSSRSDSWATYSPDGSQIAFTSLRSGVQTVWVCDSDGTQCSRLAGERSTLPAWSPDGTKLGYLLVTGGTPDLYFTDLERGLTRRVTQGGIAFRRFAWARDSQSVYYNSDHAGELQIWKRSIESGGQAVAITRGGGEGPRESPDGAYVYYMKPRPDASYKWVDVWRVPADGGEEEPVLEGKLLEGPNFILWRGSLIYRHWTSEGGNGVIDEYDLKTGEERRLLTFDLVDRLFGFGISVSPDGKWLLYSKSDPLSSDILLLESFR